jgi:hypothetical protein
MTNHARDREQVQDSIHEMIRRIAAQFRPDKIILFRFACARRCAS